MYVVEDYRDQWIMLAMHHGWARTIEDLLRADGFSKFVECEFLDGFEDHIRDIAPSIVMCFPTDVGFTKRDVLDRLVEHAWLPMSVLLVSACSDESDTRLFEYCGRNPALDPAAVASLPIAPTAFKSAVKSQLLKTAVRRSIKGAVAP